MLLTSLGIWALTRGKAGETAQWLKALVAFLDDPSPHGGSQLPVTPLLGAPDPSLTPVVHAGTTFIHTKAMDLFLKVFSFVFLRQGSSV